MEKYRLGVGAIIINQNKQIYLFERKDVPDNWQCPEGGIDEGEDPLTGALREVEEEVGMTQDNLKVLAETKEFIPYIIPEKYRKFAHIGQKKKFFLFEFTGGNSQINFGSEGDAEFVNYKLIDKKDLLDYIVDFKKDMYRKALDEFKSFFIKKFKISI